MMIRYNMFPITWDQPPLDKVVDFLDNQRKPVTASERMAGPYPYFGANGLQGTIDDYIFDESLVLLAEDGGHFGIPGRSIAYAVSGKCWVNNHAHVLRPKKNLDLRYLTRVLENYDVTPFITGSTRAKLTKAAASRIPIPLPPLDEQQRIAAILDKADALRTKRRAALAKLDTLLQATFLHMFGDPVTNPMGWERITFEKLLDSIDSGWSPKCEDRSARNGEWGVLKLSAITSCEYKDTENKALPNTLAPIPKLEVKTNDLLFSRKNTYELVAACALVRKTRSSLMLSDLIFRFNLKENSNLLPEYLWALLTHDGKRKTIQSLAGGAAGSMPNISKEKLRKIDIELPSLKSQQLFACFYNQIQKEKALQLDSLNHLDNLFHSLQQRAFKGEL